MGDMNPSGDSALTAPQLGNLKQLIPLNRKEDIVGEFQRQFPDPRTYRLTPTFIHDITKLIDAVALAGFTQGQTRGVLEALGCCGIADCAKLGHSGGAAHAPAAAAAAATVSADETPLQFFGNDANAALLGSLGTDMNPRGSGYVALAHRLSADLSDDFPFENRIDFHVFLSDAMKIDGWKRGQHVVCSWARKYPAEIVTWGVLWTALKATNFEVYTQVHDLVPKPSAGGAAAPSPSPSPSPSFSPNAGAGADAGAGASAGSWDEVATVHSSTSPLEQFFESDLNALLLDGLGGDASIGGTGWRKLAYALKVNVDTTFTERLLRGDASFRGVSVVRRWADTLCVEPTWDVLLQALHSTNKQVWRAVSARVGTIAVVQTPAPVLPQASMMDVLLVRALVAAAPEGITATQSTGLASHLSQTAASICERLRVLTAVYDALPERVAMGALPLSTRFVMYSNADVFFRDVRSMCVPRGLISRAVCERGNPSISDALLGQISIRIDPSTAAKASMAPPEPIVQDHGAARPSVLATARDGTSSAGTGAGASSSTSTSTASPAETIAPAADDPIAVLQAAIGRDATAPSDCVVCWETPSNVELKPCGHMQLCTGCAMKIMQSDKKVCPVCQAVVVSVNVPYT